MAVMQSVFTAWKNKNQVATVSLQNGQAVTGQITDDGNGEDAIKVLSLGGAVHIVPKAAVCTINDPDQATNASPPGQGSNAMRLL